MQTFEFANLATSSPLIDPFSGSRQTLSGASSLARHCGEEIENMCMSVEFWLVKHNAVDNRQ
jgi:DNA modification methylase